MEPLKRQIAKELRVAETMIKDVPDGVPGDFSLPVFPLAKAAGKKPDEYAKELALGVKSKLFEKVEAAGPFLNFFIDAKALASELLPEVLEREALYGSLPDKERKLIVEHTSANPDAPLHVGHLRNSIIGDTVSRILTFAGYPVDAQFYINDMGGQLALLALVLSRKDYEKELKKSGMKGDAWLGQEYVAANKLADGNEALAGEAKAFQRGYESGDEEAKKVIKFIIETCIDGFQQSFEALDISMDSFVPESRFVFDGTVGGTIEKLSKTKFWTKKNEVFCLDLESYGIEKELVLKRSDDTTLYTTRDLSYHLWKIEHGDCINVIANEQTLPQKQLRAALDILGVKDVEERVRHMSYELVNVPGMRMSSRSGNFVSADDVVDEAIKRAREEIDKRKLELSEDEKEHISRAVGVGAVRYNIIKIAPLKPISFRWEEALNFEGDSAPYLQYSHARACRILEKAGKLGELKIGDVEPIEKELLILISRFPSVVENAAEDLKPNIIANYAYAVAEAFNKFYFTCPVLDSDEPGFRLRLVFAARQVLSNALSLLGIVALERM